MQLDRRQFAAGVERGRSGAAAGRSRSIGSLGLLVAEPADGGDRGVELLGATSRSTSLESRRPGSPYSASLSCGPFSGAERMPAAARASPVCWPTSCSSAACRRPASSSLVPLSAKPASTESPASSTMRGPRVVSRRRARRVSVSGRHSTAASAGSRDLLARCSRRAAVPAAEQEQVAFGARVVHRLSSAYCSRRRSIFSSCRCSQGKFASSWDGSVPSKNPFAPM